MLFFAPIKLLYNKEGTIRTGMRMVIMDINFISDTVRDAELNAAATAANGKPLNLLRYSSGRSVSDLRVISIKDYTWADLIDYAVIKSHNFVSVPLSTTYFSGDSVFDTYNLKPLLLCCNAEYSASRVKFMPEDVFRKERGRIFAIDENGAALEVMPIPAEERYRRRSKQFVVELKPALSALLNASQLNEAFMRRLQSDEMVRISLYDASRMIAGESKPSLHFIVSGLARSLSKTIQTDCTPIEPIKQAQARLSLLGDNKVIFSKRKIGLFGGYNVLACIVKGAGLHYPYNVPDGARMLVLRDNTEAKNVFVLLPKNIDIVHFNVPRCSANCLSHSVSELRLDVDTLVLDGQLPLKTSAESSSVRCMIDTSNIEVIKKAAILNFLDIIPSNTLPVLDYFRFISDDEKYIPTGYVLPAASEKLLFRCVVPVAVQLVVAQSVAKTALRAVKLTLYCLQNASVFIDLRYNRITNLELELYGTVMKQVVLVNGNITNLKIIAENIDDLRVNCACKRVDFAASDYVSTTENSSNAEYISVHFSESVESLRIADSMHIDAHYEKGCKEVILGKVAQYNQQVDSGDVPQLFKT